MKAIEHQLATEGSKEQKEDRSIVTNYAFSVSDDLLNTPLASPFRRLFAILIDLMVVLLLSMIPAAILFIVLAVAIFRFGLDAHSKIWLRRFLFAISLIIFLVAGKLILSALIDIKANPDGMVFSTGGLGRDVAILKECEDEPCRINAIDNYLKNQVLSEIGADEGMATHLNQQIEWLSISLEEKEKLKAYARSKTEGIEAPKDVLPLANRGEVDFDYLVWVQYFLGSLGLGFGWAAVYFSCFTAWGKGKTIGKYIFGTRVVYLNGKTPNLWDSFSRFGGYQAGFATGLLGFLQIFWDANRQAIQDKISETLVILDR